MLSLIHEPFADAATILVCNTENSYIYDTGDAAETVQPARVTAEEALSGTRGSKLRTMRDEAGA